MLSNYNFYKMKTLSKFTMPLIFLFAILCGFVIVGARADHHDPPGDHSLATVNQLQGVYIFTDCTPAGKYEYLGTVQNGTRIAGSSQYGPVRDRMIKKVREEYPAANGAIFHFNNGSADKADAIKFDQ